MQLESYKYFIFKSFLYTSLKILNFVLGFLLGKYLHFMLYLETALAGFLTECGSEEMIDFFTIGEIIFNILTAIATLFIKLLCHVGS